METNYKINLLCVFCQSDQFEYDEENPPKDGDMIKCANCGRLNDFSAIKELAIAEEKEKIAEEFKKDLVKQLKKTFKKFK